MHADRMDHVPRVAGSGCQVIVLLLLLPLFPTITADIVFTLSCASALCLTYGLEKVQSLIVCQLLHRTASAALSVLYRPIIVEHYPSAR